MRRRGARCEYQAPPEPGRGYAISEIFLTVAASDRAGERQRLDKEIARIEVEMRAVEENWEIIFRRPRPVAIVEEHRQRLKVHGNWRS